MSEVVTQVSASSEKGALGSDIKIAAILKSSPEMHKRIYFKRKKKGKRKENLPNLHSHSLSLVVFGAGFLVAQLVLICLPPNHCPPICWMAFSASWLHKASTEEKKQDICKHYQIQYGNPVSDLSEKSEPVSDSSNTVIIYTLTHLLKKETKP